MKPSRDLVAEWHAKARAADQAERDERDADREERWTHLDGVTFAQTVNRARAGIVQSVKRRSDDGRVQYLPERIRATDAMVQDAILHMVVDEDDQVSVSYLTLGDLTPPLTARMGDTLPPGMRDVAHRSRWSRVLGSLRQRAEVTIRCACGEVFTVRDGHPLPAGDYWRRCVRVFVYPGTVRRQRLQQRERQARHDAKREPVAVDARSITDALIKARIGVLPTD